MTTHDSQGARYAVINTWNGGAGGRVVMFVSTARGEAGHNECFAWVHENTPFSYHEAVTHQGFKVEPWKGDNTALILLIDAWRESRRVDVEQSLPVRLGQARRAGRTRSLDAPQGVPLPSE